LALLKVEKVLKAVDVQPSEAMQGAVERLAWMRVPGCLPGWSGTAVLDVRGRIAALIIRSQSINSVPIEGEAAVVPAGVVSGPTPPPARVYVPPFATPPVVDTISPFNSFFVGGTAGQSNSECVQSVGQADRSIIAFVSAGSSEINGYEYVRAPGEPGGSWGGGEWTEDSDPSQFGFVHPRHGGKAIAAFLDGSTRLMTIEDLRDMRLWSRQAAQENNPKYTAGQ
jgi:prepilin-type processing-associated H-X9-DG protein